MTLYFDTSALVKLLIIERESDALVAEVARFPLIATSALAEVELLRAAHRFDEVLVPKARMILDNFNILELTPTILRTAANLLPSTPFRSLDAIHLASAMALPDLAAVCTYDIRMTQAARNLGLHAIAPE